MFMASANIQGRNMFVSSVAAACIISTTPPSTKIVCNKKMQCGGLRAICDLFLYVNVNVKRYSLSTRKHFHDRFQIEIYTARTISSSSYVFTVTVCSTQSTSTYFLCSVVVIVIAFWNIELLS